MSWEWEVELRSIDRAEDLLERSEGASAVERVGMAAGFVPMVLRILRRLVEAEIAREKVGV